MNLKVGKVDKLCQLPIILVAFLGELSELDQLDGDMVDLLRVLSGVDIPLRRVTVDPSID